MNVQALIIEANAKSAATRKQQFAKRASAEQIHNNLLKCVDIYVESFRNDPASSNTRAAFREMVSAATLSRRSLKP
jgi:hypothetical protein